MMETKNQGFVTLIHPASSYDFSSIHTYPPYGVLSLASYLKAKGVKARIYDQRLERNLEDKLKDIVSTSVLIGFSVMTIHIKEALKLTELVKKLNPHAKIVWGGAHSSIYPANVCGHPLIDFTVKSEGEETLRELVEALINDSDRRDFSSVKGLVYKDEKGRVINNPDREPINYREVPPVNWDLINLNAYLRMPSFSIPPKNTLFLFASRGCPYKCTFCINSLYASTRRWRAKAIATLVKEINSALELCPNIEHINFADENFFLDFKNVDKILDLLIDEFRGKFFWSCNLRADYFKRMDAPFLKKLKRSQFVEASMGAESGSELMLKYLKKDITVEDLKYSAKVCREYDINPVYSFIMGYPGEDTGDRKKTLQIIKELCRINPNSVILGPQLFRPYPGCELFERSKEYDFKVPGSLEEWIKFSEQSLKTSFGEGDATFYLPSVNLPWIKERDRYYIQGIGIYASKAFLSFKMLWKKRRLATMMYSVLARIRLQLNFFYFPYEYRMGTLLLRWWEGLKKAVKHLQLLMNH